MGGGRATAPAVAVLASPASRRRFGEVDALVRLDLSVPAGQITVLLGPNGAGKTTAIRMITGALNPDRGEVRTFGVDPGDDGEDVRRRCGVVSAKPALYDRLNGWDNLRLLGRAVRPAGLRPTRRSGRRPPASASKHALEKQVGRLLDRHEDPPGPGPFDPARPRPAALRRAHVGPRPRVVPRRARAHPRDDRRRPHRRDVHPPPAGGRGPGRPGRRARGRHRPDLRARPPTSPDRYWPGVVRRAWTPSEPAHARPPGARRRRHRLPTATAWPTLQLDDLARVPGLVVALLAAPASASPGSSPTSPRSRTSTSPSATAGPPSPSGSTLGGSDLAARLRPQAHRADRSTI